MHGTSLYLFLLVFIPVLAIVVMLALGTAGTDEEAPLPQTLYVRYVARDTPRVWFQYAHTWQTLDPYNLESLMRFRAALTESLCRKYGAPAVDALFGYLDIPPLPATIAPSPDDGAPPSAPCS